jgi:putative transposase
MPRTARAAVGGLCYHVINRDNARREVFHKPEDYASFCRLVQEAADRVRMRVLAYCLMPIHFHLALWPRHDGDLSRFMQWLLTAHVRRYHIGMSNGVYHGNLSVTGPRVSGIRTPDGGVARGVRGLCRQAHSA